MNNANDLTEVSVRSFTRIHGGVMMLVAHRKLSVVGSNPIRGSRCFMERETLPVIA